MAERRKVSAGVATANTRMWAKQPCRAACSWKHAFYSVSSRVQIKRGQNDVFWPFRYQYRPWVPEYDRKKKSSIFFSRLFNSFATTLAAHFDPVSKSMARTQTGP